MLVLLFGMLALVHGETLIPEQVSATSAYLYQGVTYGIERAFDGNFNPMFLDGSSYSSAAGDRKPMIFIELAEEAIINSITITNRGDCCSNRMHHHDFEVFEMDPQTNSNAPQLCGSIISPSPPAGSNTSVMCTTKPTGRFIRITKTLTGNDRDTLQAVEIVIDGTVAVAQVLTTIPPEPTTIPPEPTTLPRAPTILPLVQTTLPADPKTVAPVPTVIPVKIQQPTVNAPTADINSGEEGTEEDAEEDAEEED